MKTLEEFWSNVEKTDNHWLWKAGLSNGYPALRWIDKVMYAHNIAWLTVKGPLPNNLLLEKAKSCTEKKCIRPDHYVTILKADKARRAIRARWARHGYAVKPPIPSDP